MSAILIFVNISHSTKIPLIIPHFSEMKKLHFLSPIKRVPLKWDIMSIAKFKSPTNVRLNQHAKPNNNNA